MKIFDKIWRKDDKTVEPELQKVAEMVESGKSNKVYPILKPGDWVGIQNGALRKTLIGTPENPELVIAFGYDTPSNFFFLTQHDLQRLDPDQVLKDAYKNLEEYEVEIEVSQNLGGKVLFCSGRDFCSEKILLPQFMMAAHQLLGAEKLLVSIPRRRCMMIMGQTQDRDLMRVFLHLHGEAWKDDSYGNPPIANIIFQVEKGEIEGFKKC